MFVSLIPWFILFVCRLRNWTTSPPTPSWPPAPTPPKPSTGRSSSPRTPPPSRQDTLLTNLIVNWKLESRIGKISKFLGLIFYVLLLSGRLEFRKWGRYLNKQKELYLTYGFESWPYSGIPSCFSGRGLYWTFCSFSTNWKFCVFPTN